jgi:DNA-binding MarR family transcriptional regulator
MSDDGPAPGEPRRGAATPEGDAPPVTAADGGHHGRPPTLLYLIKQVELAVRARLDDVLRPFEVTPLQYTALTVLERRSDLSTAQLARNSFVTDQSAADMVTVLRGRGLVARPPDPRDRRRRVLRLTAAGQELLDEVRGQVAAVEARMLTGLTRREATDLRRHLAQCRAALSATRPH